MEKAVKTVLTAISNDEGTAAQKGLELFTFQAPKKARFRAYTILSSAAYFLFII